MKFLPKFLSIKTSLAFLVVSLLPALNPTWLSQARAAVVTATGTNPSVCDQTVGDSTNVSAYRLANGDCVVEFKNIGTTTWSAPGGVSSVSVLVVGGGGGGGSRHAGGGGAGGVVYAQNYAVSGTIGITVGSGGSPGLAQAGGQSGTDSRFYAQGEASAGTTGLVAKGGGFGDFYQLISCNTIGRSGAGGSSGGTGVPNPFARDLSCGISNANPLGSPTQTSQTQRQLDGTTLVANFEQYGTTGAMGGNQDYWAGGGGGGAGGAGSRGGGSGGTNLTGGNGGVGIANPISGSVVGQLVSGTRYVGGGGGGGAGINSLTAGTGGTGGGGAGSISNNTATAGTANTGGGGGGGGIASNGTNGAGGAGGSGVVIVSYTPDTTAPTVTNVTSSTTNGSYTVGTTIPIQVTFSEAVTVTGTPQLTLETGSTDRTINYTSGSGSTTLTFNYAIQAGDTTSDLNYTSTSALTLNSGTIRDAAGNNATLTLPGLTSAGSLGVNKALVIDTTAPSTSVTIAADYLTSGTSVSAILSTNETLSSVIWYYSISSNLTSPQSCGTSSSPTNGQSLSCTIPATDRTYYFYSVGTDSAGNVESAPGTADDSIIRDTLAPTVTNVTSNASGTIGLDGSPNILITFSETVTVTTSGGTPSILLETGDTDRAANYVSGSGTTQLTFTYFTQEGDSSSDLDYVATNSLTLNGGTIRDAAGNNATLTLFSPGSAGSLGANRSIVIDTLRPTLSSATVQSSGRELRLVFSETLSANIPAASTFSISDSGTARTPTAISLADSRTVALMITDTITAGRVVTISYTDPSANNDLNAIQDLVANDALTFSNFSVTNNSAVLNPLTTPSAPTVSAIETTSAIISYTSVANASSYTLLLYGVSPAGLLSTTANFVSGTRITGLSAGVRYQVKIQAVGDGLIYESSTASSGTNFTAAIRAATITSQPADTTTTTTRSASFRVSASALDGGSMSYRWHLSTDGGVSFAPISGATAATLTLSGVALTDSGNRYRVVITNSLNGATATETSTAATLTVNPAITLSGGSNLTSTFGTTASSLAITPSGGTGSITFTLSGSTTGLSINASNGIVTTDGTTPRGTVSLTITATDQRGATATQGITITISTGIATMSLSFASSPKKGTTQIITATTSVAGVVRFFEKGRVISACKARATSGTTPITATCSWRPKSHGVAAISATLTPTSSDYASVSASQSVILTRRTGARG